MNPTSKGSYTQKPFSFREIFNNDTSKNIMVEGASTVTAVTLYHPVRSISVQLLNRIVDVAKKNKPINFHPRILYKGFMYGTLGAHQLFLIGYFGHLLRKSCSKHHTEISFFENILIGAASGFITTGTITPFEVLTIRKQQDHTIRYPLSAFYRGVIPQALRQIGLGIGILALPTFFANKAQEFAPEFYGKHPRTVKICSGFLAGIITAAITQIPEIARQLLQMDPSGKKYPTTQSAFNVALKILRQPAGKQQFGIRIGVLAIATAATHTGRETYSKYFFTKE